MSRYVQFDEFLKETGQTYGTHEVQPWEILTPRFNNRLGNGNGSKPKRKKEPNIDRVIPLPCGYGWGPKTAHPDQQYGGHLCPLEPNHEGPHSCRRCNRTEARLNAIPIPPDPPDMARADREKEQRNERRKR